YYRERARGGAAMMVVEPVPAHRTGVLTRGNFRHQDDSIIAPFRRITDACREHDVVMIHQIYHVGAHGDQDNSWEPYWSPSGTPSFHDQNGSHAMTEAEIEEVIEAFVHAARRDKEGGFDGVELFAAYNALIDQFWSPLTNKRDDEWGGSLENRVRFAVDICRRIREEVGDDFIIGMTVSGAEPYAGGLTIEDKQEIAAYLDARGLVDYFTVGTGSYLNQFGKIVPSFLYDPMLGAPDAAKIKEAVTHARVQAESKIKTPVNAERVLADGQADMVSLVRAQIADPHLANKARDGRADAIRPCINCNQLCLGRRLRDYWISCLANPSVGREFEWDGDVPPPAQRPRRILVVGGGPAGLEVARVAAERGHQVTLVERTSNLGGQFRLAGAQPKRGEIGQLLIWYYQPQLEKHQVKVLLDTEMDAADVRAFGADAVVLATGSRPSETGFQRALPHVDRMPGVGQDNVCSVNDVLSAEATPGHRVLLLDDINGWWPASGTALYLAERGHQVTVVTGADGVAKALAPSCTDADTRAMFARHKIESLTSTALLSWQGTTARLVGLHDNSEWEREFDSLVLATTNRPEDGLQKALADSGIEAYAIGDCVAPRTASMAFYEGRKLGLKL
ncbi:MAG: FAD-dependent oxidoreductase, partial [Alphaproteobacteria bacterium]